jgi:nitrogen fixation-related uncharacterized protein
MNAIGKTIILIGLALVTFGVLVYIFEDKLSWFGNLPGDIRIEKTNFKFYFPITSMLLISVILNAILWAVKKFL